MNADECTNAVMAHLAERVEIATDEYGDERVASMRERIGIPVERTGGKVIRSVEGEAPRKDTEAYSNSWRKLTRQSGDEIIGEIASDIFYGPILENTLNRPHIAPEVDKTRDEAAQRIKSKL